MLIAITLTALAFSFYALWRGERYGKREEYESAIQWLETSLVFAGVSFVASVLYLLLYSLTP